jgi:hypothetical protein
VDKNSGCWFAALLAFIVGVSGYVALSDQSPVKTSPALNTPSLLVVTLESPTIKQPFVVQNSQILYGHADTIACEKIMQGQVFDLEGEAQIDDIKIAVEMLEEPDDDLIGYAFPGNDPSVGESGWSMLLPNIDYPYLVWLESAITGEQLSDKVFVEVFPEIMPDCGKNLIIINFVQIRSIE